MWKPIETAPWNKIVALKGDSGTTATKEFLLLGYRDKEYRGEAWLTIHNARLTDYGYEPTHWRDKDEVM